VVFGPQPAAPIQALVVFGPQPAASTQTFVVFRPQPAAHFRVSARPSAFSRRHLTTAPSRAKPLAMSRWRASRRRGLSWLGTGLALLVPALAVGALALPHKFKAGTPVSAAAMNENFSTLTDAIDSLVTSVEQLQGKKPGLPKILDASVDYAHPKLILKTTATGMLYARPVGSASNSLGVSLWVGDGVSNADPPAMMCGVTACSGFAARAFESSSASVLVPADSYVMVAVEYSAQVAATVNLMWQPLDASQSALPVQTYPVK